MRRLALAACLLLCACTTIEAQPSPSPSPSVSSAVASPAASPSPSPAGPALIVAAIGRVPGAFHYFDEGAGEGFRILLFDEEAGRPPSEVVHGGRGATSASPNVRTTAFSASADGRTLVVMVLESAMTYYVVRPETGEMRVLLSGPDLGPPVVSADGQRVAYARTSEDPAINGVWIAPIASGVPAPSRAVSDVPQRAGGPPQPISWSGDGGWLAISASQGDGSQEIALVDPNGGPTRYDATNNTLVGGRTRMIGPGTFVDWRGGDAHLLVTSSRSLFGGRTVVYEANATTGTTRALYAPSGDVHLGPAVWHPALDRYALIERPIVGGLTAPTTVWVRRLDGTATKTTTGSFLSDPWWSRDGLKLFATAGGDDSNGRITDLLSGSGTPFCVRGGTPPACQ